MALTSFFEIDPDMKMENRETAGRIARVTPLQQGTRGRENYGKYNRKYLWPR